MSKILIIGASGQDGVILRRHLHARDTVLAATSELSWIDGLQNSKGVGFCERNLPEFLKRVSRFRPDYVYYLPAVHGPSSSSVNQCPSFATKRKFVDQYGLGRLTEQLDSNEKPVGLLYTASSKIFGSATGLVSEKTDFNPLCCYSESKASAVIRLENTSSDYIGVITAILFHHHSRYRIGDYALNRIAHFLSGGYFQNAETSVVNDWLASEDFSSAFEICRVLKLLLTRRHQHRFVIGSGVPRSLSSIAIDAARRLGIAEHLPLKNFSPEIHDCSFADRSKLAKNNICMEDLILDALVDQIQYLSGINALGTSA